MEKQRNYTLLIIGNKRFTQTDTYPIGRLIPTEKSLILKRNQTLLRYTGFRQIYTRKREGAVIIPRDTETESGLSEKPVESGRFRGNNALFVLYEARDFVS